MYGIEEYYYKVNRVFMKTLGLWPYQQPYIAQLQKVLFSSILFSFILVQCLACFTMKFSTDLFLKILSFLFPTLFATTKYCVFVIRADSVKLLLEEIRNDLTLLKNEVEIDIIKKYADNMRFITMVSIVSSYAGTVCYVMSQYLLPLLLNVLLPLNASRSLELIGITEYFVNREKFFWALLFHEVVTVYVGVTAVCSTGGTTIMYFLHSCALFKVARYIELWSSNFMVPFTILILIGVSSLSFNLFHLLQLVIVLDDPSEMYFAFLLITLHVGYMFALNYGGQEIQNHGVQLFEAIYNGLWYAAPLHTQKLLLFLMQKAAVKVTLVCGSIFVASLEGFVTLVSSAVSYFTVMYSTRQ
ncbi:uncharacterized protein LOC105285101 isoform X5 [Ooceraea biroi]|uniref:uncharacterized protein LOC105285101 isoform X5 n=1 Tax=Ooceraea biroi TaxID=2015173 RepID=UPI0005B8253C|nr:uncharacterized protein LOC105285101 isoform X5 [Ooceraea biroi]